MCQHAAYASLKTAMKVLQEKKQERLYKTLLEEVGQECTRKVLDEKRVSKMKASNKKVWSIQSLQWMAHMPEELIKRNITLQSTKEELKKWIRENIPVKGDRILWGQKLTGDMQRKKKKGQAEAEGDSDGNDRNEDAGEADKERKDGDEVNDNKVEQEEVEKDELERDEVERDEVGQNEIEQEEEKETSKNSVVSKVNWKM